MNNVSLTGRLATDVELKELDSERRVAGFLLAVDRAKEGEADFFWISAWNKQADTCHQFLRKGKQVGVYGRLRSRSWEEEGKRRSAVDVVAHRVEFLSPADGDATAAEVPFEAVAR
jgi:single-strand DNA-binding protein